MRTNYRNGDEITLTANGCDGCSPAVINGVLCHEQGCPDAWRDESQECAWCGQTFHPEERIQSYCEADCMFADLS